MRRPGVPPEPKTRPANPEPQLPAPSSAGCQWCGQQPNPLSTSCGPCAAEQRTHTQFMNELTREKLKLEIKIMEAELANQTRGDDTDA